MPKKKAKKKSWLKLETSAGFSIVLIYLFTTVATIFIIFAIADGYNLNFLNFLTFNHPQKKYPLPLPVPDKVKGIYLTGYSFATKKTRNNLINLIENSQLNAIVIDLKDPNNKPIFYPTYSKLKSLPLSSVVLDNKVIKYILNDLQNRKIYTIARITTFQDNQTATHFPNLALKNKSGATWYNWGGISWLDMTNPETWEIPVLFAKEAAKLGFDEVQFDYVRFPSDGNVKQISYYNLPPGQYKWQVLDRFYQYVDKKLKKVPVYTSIDLFGLTYQRHQDKNYDLNVGQRLVDAAKYFDFVSPMVYPSHYPSGYLGFANPAKHPYDVVYKAMSEGNVILNSTTTMARSRPWLQDFNLGAVYTAEMVKAQMKASDENKTAGWLLWNPRNIYDTGALK